MGSFRRLRFSLSDPASGLFNIVCRTNLWQVTSPSQTGGNQKAHLLLSLLFVLQCLTEGMRGTALSLTKPPQEPALTQKHPPGRRSTSLIKQKPISPAALFHLFLCLTFIWLWCTTENKRVVRVRGKKRPNKQAAFCMATVGINILSTENIYKEISCWDTYLGLAEYI